jgi:hypothetical protein
MLIDKGWEEFFPTLVLLIAKNVTIQLIKEM